MKKLLVLILGISLFACTQEKGFKINVSLDGTEGPILLEKRGTSAWIPVDTADIVEGIAVLEGEVSYPEDYYISVLGERAKMIVFVENVEMSVVGKADSIGFAKVSGSLTHDEYDKVNSDINKIGEEYMALYQEAREAIAAGNTAKGEELMDKVDEMYKSIFTLQEDFIKNNPASFASPYFLNRLQRRIEFNKLETLVDALDPKLDSVQSIVSLKKRIEVLKPVAVGQIAPDFTQNDKDGNPVKFSDIYSKNELTLLDFWAAWCSPCRGENPNVVAVYNEYKTKGFSVFGVSLDNKKEDWLKAIDDDGLTWDHVSELNGWSNSAAKMYAVEGIPHSLLVDKTGKIIARDKRGKELGKTVGEFFN